MKSFLSAILFLISPILLAGEYQWRQECDAAQNTMNKCSYEEFQFHDAELNALYKEQMGFLKFDENKIPLREAQRAWISFRDKSCRYEAGDSKGAGTGWPISQNKCLTYHTKQRVNDLKRYISCRENGCPH